MKTQIFFIFAIFFPIVFSSCTEEKTPVSVIRKERETSDGFFTCFAKTPSGDTLWVSMPKEVYLRNDVPFEGTVTTKRFPLGVLSEDFSENKPTHDSKKEGKNPSYHKPIYREINEISNKNSYYNIFIGDSVFSVSLIGDRKQNNQIMTGIFPAGPMMIHGVIDIGFGSDSAHVWVGPQLGTYSEGVAGWVKILNKRKK